MNNENTVRVWDPGVRLFHWGLVATFTVSYLSGEMHDLHTWAGYTLLGLLLFRLIWGFVGGRYARFKDFIYGPRAGFAYLYGLIRAQPVHYTGHNPVGGWMIFLMLTILLAISFTGLKALGLEGEGPFAANRFELIATAHAHGDETHNKAAAPQEPSEPSGDADVSVPKTETVAPAAPATTSTREEAFWSEAHSQLVDLMLILIGIHIAGVIVSSLLHRENLARAMITGKKRIRT